MRCAVAGSGVPFRWAAAPTATASPAGRPTSQGPRYARMRLARRSPSRSRCTWRSGLWAAAPASTGLQVITSLFAAPGARRASRMRKCCRAVPGSPLSASGGLRRLRHEHPFCWRARYPLLLDGVCSRGTRGWNSDWWQWARVKNGRPASTSPSAPYVSPCQRRAWHSARSLSTPWNNILPFCCSGCVIMSNSVSMPLTSTTWMVLRPLLFALSDAALPRGLHLGLHTSLFSLAAGPSSGI
mmetsp:Transcript_1334/g.5398  ORF Transcript_1334/g.5398 Transcript_1334/m.5398 type:complete len:241 (-) Transcript_1334:1006-1728(-)